MPKEDRKSWMEEFQGNECLDRFIWSVIVVLFITCGYLGYKLWRTESLIAVLQGGL